MTTFIKPKLFKIDSANFMKRMRRKSNKIIKECVAINECKKRARVMLYAR